MQRWKPALAALAAAGAAALAGAQTVVREAPPDVRPGLLAVSATPPIVAVDGQPARLSPGARIRDTRNLLVLSQALAGRTVPAVYRRDGLGLVHEVWLLTPEEYAKLGGSGASGDAEGLRRFQELLTQIFAARAVAGMR